MSSYMLSHDEYQSIANWLYMQGGSKVSSHSYTIKTFIGFEPGSLEFHNTNKEKIKEKTQIAVRHLYNLNRLALTARYGDPYNRSDETQFIPKEDPYCNERNVIKALQSLSYQLGEYIIMETDTYKQLKAFISELCENIFNRCDK